MVVVPGEAFGTNDHVRMSYATSMTELERGLDSIARRLSQLVDEELGQVSVAHRPARWYVERRSCPGSGAPDPTRSPLLSTHDPSTVRRIIDILFCRHNYHVVLTAHFAGPTWENQYTRFRNAFDNCQRVIRGEKPLWIIPELQD